MIEIGIIVFVSSFIISYSVTRECLRRQVRSLVKFSDNVTYISPIVNRFLNKDELWYNRNDFKRFKNDYIKYHSY